MEPTIKVTVLIEMTHDRVTVDDDGKTVRAHRVTTEAFTTLLKHGWNEPHTRVVVVLNGQALTLVQIRGSEEIVFRRMTPLMALAVAGVA